MSRRPNKIRQVVLKPRQYARGPSEDEAEPQEDTPPSRVGKSLIGGHFPTEVQIALKVLAAQERTTVQALLAEGINAVFARRKKPEIA